MEESGRRPTNRTVRLRATCRSLAEIRRADLSDARRRSVSSSIERRWLASAISWNNLETKDAYEMC